MSDPQPAPAPPPAPGAPRRRPGPLAVTLVFLALVAGALLAARLVLSSRETPHPSSEGALFEGPEVPEFSFTERGGRTVTKADMLGRIWIVDFIFTTCAGVCPEMSEALRKVHEQIRRDPDAVCVSITVDPETDTPEVLREYARKYGASEDRWLFLRGDRRAVHAFGFEGFGLLDPKDPFLHSRRAALVDRQGRIRATFPLNDAGGVKELLDAYRRLRDGKDG